MHAEKYIKVLIKEGSRMNRKNHYFGISYVLCSRYSNRQTLLASVHSVADNNDRARISLTPADQRFPLSLSRYGILEQFIQFQ
jgi:hypothetical protein